MSAKTIAHAFQIQAQFCQAMNSPLTANLLHHAAKNLLANGVMTKLLPHWRGNPIADALALRFAGAIHYAILKGKLQSPNNSQWENIADLITKEKTFLRDFINRNPPQTNETGRAAAILPALLEIAARASRPIALREMGASAGLNLFPDRFFYDANTWQWGEEASGVRLTPRWEGETPKLTAPLFIHSRGGCDKSPIDLKDEEAVMRLRAYLWQDQPERQARLLAARTLALGGGVDVERMDADDWVARELEGRARGVATVFYHTVVWQYLGDERRARILALMEEAGRGADRDSPLCWLRVEPDDVASRGFFPIRLSFWPGGDFLLGEMEPHGRSVAWHGLR